MTPPDDYFSNPEFQVLEANFHAYVAQGEGRSVSWLAAKTGLPLSTVARGMVKGNWLQRVQSIATEASVETRKRLVGDVAGMNEQDVGRLTELEDEAYKSLLVAIQNNEVKPDTLVRIMFGALAKRREFLGLTGGQATNPMQKLLEASITNEKTPATPFAFDPSKLDSPDELPTMPGMTSDEDVDEDPRRPLDAAEKKALRP